MAEIAFSRLSHLFVFVILDSPLQLLCASLAQSPKGDLLVDLLRKRIKLNLICSFILVLLAPFSFTVVHQQAKL
jgi:hypothetical protein